MPRPKFKRIQSIHKTGCISHIIRYKYMMSWTKEEFNDFCKAHEVKTLLKLNNDFKLAEFRDVMKIEFQKAFK